MSTFNIQLHVPNNDHTGWNIWHPETAINNIVDENGAGILGADDRIKTKFLPQWITGQMKYISSIADPAPALDDLVDLIESYLTSPSGLGLTSDDLTASNAAQYYSGKFFIVGGSETLTFTQGGKHYFDNFDDNESGSTTSLEPGDWLVLNSKNGANFYWGVINNRYAEANTSSKGVVQLATKAQAEGFTNDSNVLTPKTGFDLVNKKLLDYVTNATFSAFQEAVIQNYALKMDLTPLQNSINNLMVNKQDKLVFTGTGQNIKTVANKSLGGQGNIVLDISDISGLTAELNKKLELGTVSNMVGDAVAEHAGAVNAHSNVFASYAKKESPTFTGTPTAPTAAYTTNNTQIATTAFVRSAINNFNKIPAIPAANFPATPDADVYPSGMLVAKII